MTLGKLLILCMPTFFNGKMVVITMVPTYRFIVRIKWDDIWKVKDAKQYRADGKYSMNTVYYDYTTVDVVGNIRNFQGSCNYMWFLFHILTSEAKPCGRCESTRHITYHSLSVHKQKTPGFNSKGHIAFSPVDAWHWTKHLTSKSISSSESKDNNGISVLGRFNEYTQGAWHWIWHTVSNSLTDNIIISCCN